RRAPRRNVDRSDGRQAHRHGPARIDPDLPGPRGDFCATGTTHVELIEQMVRLVRSGAADWRPGARELLTDLGRHEVPCALVTMSYQQLADVVIEMLPAGTFDTVVTGDQVNRGKPHPEPYLLAA